FKQKLAKCNPGQTIRWRTPSGFEVIQAYPMIKYDRVETTLCGKVSGRVFERFAPVSAQVTDEINKLKQTKGLAPNIIHSLDAAHMCFLVAGTCSTISHYLMIHDS